LLSVTKSRKEGRHAIRQRFERLPDKVDWSLHEDFNNKTVHDADQRIIRAAQEAGVSPFNAATMPQLKGPFTVGRKLNVARYVQGEDRCMLRDIGRNDPSRMTGVRIFVQLSAINYETHEKILNRAVAALAVADKIRGDGRSVEIIATWAGVGDRDMTKIAIIWKPVEAASAKQLAEISNPSYFRTVVMGWWDSGRSIHDKRGIIGFGKTYPIVTFKDYKSVIKSLQQPGDVVINWSLPTIQDQINNGLEQV
jgi:hypothetical protein